MADKAPATKLPLAVRKNVRDEWEAKKPEFEKNLSAILGSDYIEDAVRQIKRFADSHGKAGTEELNSVCTTHTVTLSASTNFSYCGCTIADGKLNLEFGPKNLGTNINDILADLPKVLSQAPQPPGASKLSFAARHAISQDYEPKIGPVLELARKQLANPKLEFDPNFEELSAMLKDGKDVGQGWERNLGKLAVEYFESFTDTLKRQKFSDDEMLREGFEEGVPKGIVKLKVVEKMSGYNALLLEDGMVILQTTPGNWGVNINDMAHKLVDLL